MKIFETTRLYVEKFNELDFEDFYDMQSNPKVMRFIKKHMNKEESKTELNRFISYYDDPNIFYKIWAVKKQTNNELIGLCGVYENGKSEFEIAYRLREKFWKQGFGREIANELINYLFKNTDLTELTASVRIGNKGSIKILENEMDFNKEIKHKKSSERIYKLRKKNWLQQRI